MTSLISSVFNYKYIESSKLNEVSYPDFYMSFRTSELTSNQIIALLLYLRHLFGIKFVLGSFLWPVIGLRGTPNSLLHPRKGMLCFLPFLFINFYVEFR